MLRFFSIHKVVVASRSLFSASLSWKLLCAFFGQLAADVLNGWFALFKSWGLKQTYLCTACSKLSVLLCSELTAGLNVSVVLHLT